MSKIKITLTNGTLVEKPLVTAFKGNYGTYIVLDDERQGNMGLPVILVSKIQDNKAMGIIDPNEWSVVKDNLRNIINGTPTEYVAPSVELSADENYCSQLTLPVDYFDVLKNSYKPSDSNDNTVLGTVPEAEVAPAAVAPSVDASPVIPDATPTEPVMPTSPVEPAPVVDAPSVDVAPVTNDFASNEFGNTTRDFTSEKQEFLKACENAFDTLIAIINSK